MTAIGKFIYKNAGYLESFFARGKNPLPGGERAQHSIKGMIGKFFG